MGHVANVLDHAYLLASETLKGLPKFDGKDPEQSMQEINVWLMQKGRCHLGLLNTEAKKEDKVALKKWEIRNDSAYYAAYSSAKFDASAKEVADTYHKECVDGNPPRGPRAIE